MLESLIRGLHRVGADVDVVALADALWLARAMGDAAGDGTPDPSGGPAGPGPGQEPYEDPAGQEGTPDPLTAHPSRPEPGTYDTGGVPDGPGTLAAVTGRVRRGSALPDGPAVARALRPLRRRRPGGRERGLDVDATVALYARTDELTPVFTALPERWFRLDLVVDASPSMQVWRDTADDLHDLLRRLGAFSTVRRWTLRPGPDGAPVLHGPAGGPVPHGLLQDARGRALLLVLSDCVADGWHAPGTWRMLRDWTRSTATVLLNPLPRTLWPHTGLDGPVVPLAARGRGARSADLAAGVPDGLRRLLAAAYPEVTGPWLPCPVAGISAPAARSWAGTLMAVGVAACEGVLIPPGGRPPDPQDEDEDDPYAYPYASPYAYPDPDAVLPVAEAELLVDAFRRVSSPQARRLAVLCSPQTELSLPVLRAVQAAMEPGSGVDVLAELVVSDLFEHVPGTESGELRLRFRPGVREELRTSLSAEDAWQVFFALSRFADAEAARGTGHPVAVADGRGTARVPEGLAPFAAASRAVLRLLGAGPEAAPTDAVTARPVPQDGLWIRIGRNEADPSAYTLEAWTLGDRRLIASDQVTGVGELQSRVTSAMDDGWAALAPEAPGNMITIDLPWELLDTPFDTWTGPGNEPHGVLHPVVFRCFWQDPERHAGHDRWDRLLTAGGRVRRDQVYWPGDGFTSSGLVSTLRADGRLLCLVLDGPPTSDPFYDEQFRIAQAEGIPVVVWSREEGDGARFRECVELLFAMETSLPESLSALHRRAWLESGALAPLALVWNDPALEGRTAAVSAVREPEPLPRARTYAVVVGVEAYAGEDHRMDLNGPAHDVRGITEWLLAEGVPADHITALVSPVEDNREVTEGLGVPTREATAANVRRALLRETAARADADLLLVFWSGHGTTDANGAQYLLTADDAYGPGVSLTDLLRRFRSPEVSTCEEQFWFIDACATAWPAVEEEAAAVLPDPLPPRDLSSRPHPLRRQYVYMASGPENDAVEEAGRGGLFSLQLIEALREVRPWDADAPSALYETLRERVARQRGRGRTRQTPVFVHYGGQRPPDDPAGRP
ncbi:SAV_2336 N-terminal domain-related protein [Streptomyces racemochromogenes]|uniref:SAV_2336 N-terminal domain-related protein n=1 Tax=Streptomyces racemochromogenes TaxID=67353 RepID=UPI0035EAC55C